MQRSLLEGTDADDDERPKPWTTKETFAKAFASNLEYEMTIEQTIVLTQSQEAIQHLTSYRNSGFIGRDHWADIMRDKTILKAMKIEKNTDILLGAAHTLNHGLTDCAKQLSHNENAYPAYWHFAPDSSIALVPLVALNHVKENSTLARDSLKTKEFGLWVLIKNGSTKNAVLVLGTEGVIKGVFGSFCQEIPQNLDNLAGPHSIAQTFRLPTQPKGRCTIL